MIYGYGRVSTNLQTSENQKLDIEKSLGMPVDFWYEDHATSGTVRAEDRSQFSEMMSKLTSGDTVVFSRVDRVGRRASNILTTVEDLISKGIIVYILQIGREPLNSPMGKVMLGMMSIFAELDRDNIVERVNSGLRRAKAEGVRLGRPTVCPQVIEKMKADKKNGMTNLNISKKYSLSLKSVAKYLDFSEDDIVKYKEQWKSHQEQIKRNKEK